MAITDDQMAKLKAKAKNSNISIPSEFPEGGYDYDGLCIVPGNEKYFTSEAEADEYRAAAYERSLAEFFGQ